MYSKQYKNAPRGRARSALCTRHVTEHILKNNVNFEIQSANATRIVGLPASAAYLSWAMQDHSTRARTRVTTRAGRSVHDIIQNIHTANVNWRSNRSLRR